MIRLGSLLQSSAIMVMRPDDLVGFTRRTYARSRCVRDWSRNELVDAGLFEEEKELLDKLPVHDGRLLVLGVGGGREAIPLARLGFRVTGVDFIPELVKNARANARERGVEIDGLVQEISELEVEAGSFDVVWLSAAMYSSIPTRARRRAMLGRIGRALAPDGYFLCQFAWDAAGSAGPGRLRRMLALATGGNLSFEPGDMLFMNREFSHVFSSESQLREEFEEGGFRVEEMLLPRSGNRGGAVLKKKESATR